MKLKSHKFNPWGKPIKIEINSRWIKKCLSLISCHIVGPWILRIQRVAEQWKKSQEIDELTIVTSLIKYDLMSPET